MEELDADILLAGQVLTNFYGGEGNDKLYGESSADILYGDAGNILYGGAFMGEDDTLSGESSADIL